MSILSPPVLALGPTSSVFAVHIFFNISGVTVCLGVGVGVGVLKVSATPV